MCGDDHYFAATGIGIIEGDFLRGVRYTQTGAVTTSLVIRSRPAPGVWWNRITAGTSLVALVICPVDNANDGIGSLC